MRLTTLILEITAKTNLSKEKKNYPKPLTQKQ
jgi:hypothetical protein